MPQRIQKAGSARSAWKGAVAGLCGGLAGAWTMRQFAELWWRLGRDRSSEEDEITSNAAEIAYRKLLHRGPSPAEQHAAATAIHYGVSSILGMMYGAGGEYLPALGAGLGLPFATIFWYLGDEIAAPKLNLAHPETYPRSKRAKALAAHLVYGATTDVVRAWVRRLL